MFLILLFFRALCTMCVCVDLWEKSRKLGNCKTPKRKKSSGGSKKKKKVPLRFDSTEEFSAMDWIQKRQFANSPDVDKLQEDVVNWNKAFQTYHETASDGKFSALRTGGVNSGFISTILEMNPNKHDVKILKKFALDRLFHRIIHKRHEKNEFRVICSSKELIK